MKKVILDTDTAGDDTLAILTVLDSPELELLGLTIAGGNVQFEQQVENALYTLEIAGVSGKVPVYKGHAQAMMGDHQTVEEVHGDDGMGNAYFPKAVQRAEEDKHAVDFIIEQAHKHPGELTLLAIAPLTNIAMALLKDPSIVKKIEHLYIMGGTNNALGNVTPAAEFNFLVDPEAAKIVMHAGLPITMVGWEMATRYSVMTEEDHRQVRELGTKGATFFTDINKVVEQFNTDVHRLPGTTHPDSLLVAIAGNPKIMTDSHRYYVDVETKGELTRGYSLVDVNGRLGKEPNVHVCEMVDVRLFKDTLLNALKNIT
ncbi:nucleoside hydrolase [Shouchella shacheensis]|uniref:nucleoside hydrolase n=1 Tax=Shouchella shacheensis TaxID=1649580 RepID=UPI0007401D10|nr:nucleoside hydrolase [Shouchella shacheensis]